MKAILPVFLALGTVAFAGESSIPERLPLSRYDKLVTEWPFAVGKPTDTPPVPPISPFQNLYLGSAAKLSDGGVDRDWVVIRDSSDASWIVQLFGAESNADGFKLVKVTWADDPKNIKATVTKGTETRELETDQGAWRATAPAVQNIARPAIIHRYPAVSPAPISTPKVRGSVAPR
jgi:hypothetical protein